MTITVADLNKSTCSNDAHYNMGPRGYGYGYRCIEYPRLRFIDRTYKEERRTERTWYVDGAECASLEAAAAALNTPPVVTDDEAAALARIPSAFVNLRKMEDVLAGCDRPAGGIMPDTPHSRVNAMISQLRDKGLVELGRHPERNDGEPWDECVPEHMRWSPTIRRVET